MPPRLHALATALLGATLAAQAPGLRLFQEIGSAQSQMLDTNGAVAHTWPGTGNLTTHMQPDGDLVRGVQTGTTIGAGGATGRLQRLTFDGTITWDFLVDNSSELAHHDIEPMPNGNVLVMVWQVQTASSAIGEGRNPALLSGPDWYPDSIIELQPTGPTSATVVWEWHMMDHVIQDYDSQLPNFGVVANHPELLDLNFPPIVVSDGDWNHFNGIDYDPVHDWIIVSARQQNEIYVIDHSTTTLEAAGHTGGQRGKGGDLLYRWGNPLAYGAGTAGDQQLFGQHDPRFIPLGYPGAGNVTLFNNVYQATQSAVFEITLPVDPSGNLVINSATGRYGPLTPTWIFTDPTVFSPFVSSAERLPNGNTLICSGVQKTLLEVTPAGQTVWSYSDPAGGFMFQVNYVDRALWVDATTLSIGGGQVGFDHLLGSASAGGFYLLLGSVSGTAPGTVLPGGVLLPLNPDYLTTAMATAFNSGIFVDTIGTLDALGGAASSIVVNPGFIPPGLVGTQMHFAHMIFDNTLISSSASNPVMVSLTL